MESESQTNKQHNLGHLRKALEDKESEIATLQERNEEHQHRERQQMQARDEENEHLRNQLRQMRRPPAFSHSANPKVKVEKYDGKTSAIQWWLKFTTFINLQKLTEKMAIETLPFYFAGAAESWYFSLDTAVKRFLTVIKEAIHQRFQTSPRNNLELMDVKQKKMKSVDDFIHRVTQMTTDRHVEQDWLITVIMNDNLTFQRTL